MTVLLAIIGSFLVAVVLAAAAARWGAALGFVDAPGVDPLKPHATPAVPLGGVAVFTGLHLGMAVGGVFDSGFFVATALLLVLGLADDRLDLSPLIRLAVELGAGIALVVLADVPEGGVLTWLFGVAFVVVAINAVNLYDGLDGLAGGAGLVAAVMLGWLAEIRGGDAVTGLVVATALAGFLVMNWHPARVFLGDNGSYVVGATLAYLVLASSPSGGLGDAVLAAIVIGVFAIDVLVTVGRRLRAGAPLFAGDRSHVYDRLHQRGWTVPDVALASAATQAVIGAVVILLADPRLEALIVGLGTGGIGAIVVMRAERTVSAAAPQDADPLDETGSE